MIEFDTLEYRNFMSVGNEPMTINFKESPSTIVIGQNGHGKSSFVDALCFATCGEAYRDIKKGQLINSVNRKQSVVTLTFNIGKDRYKIIRGQKPTIFEYYKNDELVKQDAGAVDYQKGLERILGFNSKTFSQVIALGSTAYKPFMKLTVPERRVVIDEVLDIAVLTRMAKLNKINIDNIKPEISEASSIISVRNSNIQNQQRIIESLNAALDDKKVFIQGLIDAENISLKEAAEKHKLIKVEIDELEKVVADLPEVTNSYSKLNEAIQKRKYALVTINERLSFMATHDDCEACGQGIAHDHKSKSISENETKKAALNEQLEKYATIEAELKTRLSNLQAEDRKLSVQKSTLRSIAENGKHHMNKISSLKKDLEAVSSGGGNLEVEKAALAEHHKALIDEQDYLKHLNIQRKLFDTSIPMLKDDGIKALIIKEYLPVINLVINQYLEKLDFFVKFELDENFDEVIKSRHRDEFSYNSFSEGEKQKLDVSILLAWRHIAKLKNSVNTNLLVLDEVLNSNLDAMGVDYLMEIIEDLKKETNVFVITHNPAIVDRFDRVIEVEKVGNFARIK